jgi:very-short-patch-repair endonuclease
MGISEREYKAMLAGNPELVVADDPGAATAAQLEQMLARGGATPVTAVTPVNALAQRFEALWQTWGGPDLRREYRFHPARKWRADYCHLPTKTIIELEGGIYNGGRHTQAAGFRGDCEKYNAAAMLGYTVLRLATGQVDDAHVGEIADYVRRKAGQ